MGADTNRSSRPSAFVRSAAVILFSFGGLFALVSLDEGVDSLVLGVVLLGLGSALWWGRRVGYYVGLTGTALFVGLVGLVAADNPEMSSWIALGIASVPLVLLLPPAARRPAPTPDLSPESGGLQHPEGWTRELAGGVVLFAFMAICGTLVFGVGVAMTVDGEWRVGGTAAAFGAAMLSTLPLFMSWPRGRRRIRLTTLSLNGDRATGVLFPYSPLRSFAILLLWAFFGLASLGFLAFAREFASSDSPVWVNRVVGGAGALLFLGGAIVMSARNRWRRWRVVLLPRAVIFHGASRAAVPWDAIADIEAYETTFYARGFPIRERFVRIVTREPAAITGDRYDQALRHFFPSVAADVTMPIRPLAVDPKVLLHALKYYHAHPEARSELDDPAAVQRIRQGNIRPTDE